MNYVIGVDFDNTVVNYDEVMLLTAREMGLAGVAGIEDKKGLRDTIRALPDGETAWQKLQAVVYGTRMNEARLEPDVERFFEMCGERAIPVSIVSHKTQFPAQEPKHDLRVSALNWMRANRFFESDGLRLKEGGVFFESTRQNKIQRIAALGCTHFIDDLEEIFQEPSFPRHIEKILYDPHRSNTSIPGVHACDSWRQIAIHFFHA